jgi:hypothetical protein
LSDEALADVSNDCGLMAKSEGVQELSPGWRLGGTLGTGSKKARSSERARESVEQSNKGHAIFEDDDKLRRRGFSAAPSERSAFNVEYPGFRRASTPG